MSDMRTDGAGGRAGRKEKKEEKKEQAHLRGLTPHKENYQGIGSGTVGAGRPPRFVHREDSDVLVSSGKKRDFTLLARPTLSYRTICAA